jgi:hypothetical protein
MSDDPTQPNVAEVINTGLKLGAEVLVPGGSNIVKGDLGTAAAHVVLGLGTKALFGLPGLIAVSANSLSNAFTGRGLLSHLGFRREGDNVLRVVAKEGIKTGMRIQRGVRDASSRANEGLQDIVAEAQSELDQERPGDGDQSPS